KEGQLVKKGQLMFKIRPILYQAKWEAEKAEADYAQLEYDFTKQLSQEKVVSNAQVQLNNAKLAKAKARANLAKAELGFTQIVAQFEGIVDRLQRREGSMIKAEDVLTNLTDNSVMWVYFPVTEKRYLQYMAETNQNKQSPEVELMLANHTRFQNTGKIA